MYLEPHDLLTAVLSGVPIHAVQYSMGSRFRQKIFFPTKRFTFAGTPAKPLLEYESAYNKEGNSNMIFTSNKNPALWREDFNEDATLLCALDRIFDDATVFKLRGESFRGKKLETISLQTGKVKAVEPAAEMKE